MADQDSYFKRASDKVSSIANASRQKASEIAQALSKVASGNDGSLGSAKSRIAERQKQIDEAVDAATEVKANGGVVGAHSKRQTAYPKRPV